MPQEYTFGMETADKLTGSQVLEEAEKIVASLPTPPEVDRVDVAIGPDHQNEMALWFKLILKRDGAETSEALRSLRQYSNLLVDRVFASGITWFPYTSVESPE